MAFGLVFIGIYCQRSSLRHEDKSHGMERIEVKVKLPFGNAHLGHVFTDLGPESAGGLQARHQLRKASA